MDLFSYSSEQENQTYLPLAARLRPRKLEEFIGQEEVIGRGKFLRQMIENDTIPSLLFVGPPGSGKTTLATIIAESTQCRFEKINAVSAGVADVRRIVATAKEDRTLYRRRTILFIDEIHRFNKGQQDALLPYVEEGKIILIGATTENPYFEIISPLLSRMRMIRLKLLDEQHIQRILLQALHDSERGFGQQNIGYSETAIRQIAFNAGGDARIALNVLEQCVSMLAEGQLLSEEIVSSVIGPKAFAYDKQGDQHYDVISAFIKSMRGSDADAALHYLARMLEAGEDVGFIARRIVICSAEDVGLADPEALKIAVAAAQAIQFVGMPEARIILAEAVIYIATAPKSNSAYIAIDQAITDIRQNNCGTVPQHLRDASYRGAAHLGHGKGYIYPHDDPTGVVVQQYLPDPITEKIYYKPTMHGSEALISERYKQRGNK